MVNASLDIQTELSALLKQVDDSLSITSEEKQAIWVQFDQLWGKTDEAGRVLIKDAWAHVESIAEQNASLAFKVTASGNIAQAALVEAQADRDALEAYEEWMAEEAWPESLSTAFNDLYEDMVRRVQYLSRCSPKAARLFATILMGRNARFTEYQSELFAAFMGSFEPAPEDARNGH